MRGHGERQFAVIATQAVPNWKTQQLRKNTLETEPICTIHIWIFNAEHPFLLQCNSTLKVVWFYPFVLVYPRGQLWNSEPSLEFGQWIFAKFEGAHIEIFRDRVYVSCVSLDILPFRATSQLALQRNMHLTQITQASPLPGMEIPKILSCSSSEYWNQPFCCTVLLWSHTPLGKCISPAGMMWINTAQLTWFEEFVNRKYPFQTTGFWELECFQIYSSHHFVEALPSLLLIFQKFICLPL